MYEIEKIKNTIIQGDALLELKPSQNPFFELWQKSPKL
jgi:hypothetical protein